MSLHIISMRIFLTVLSGWVRLKDGVTVWSFVDPKLDKWGQVGKFGKCWEKVEHRKVLRMNSPIVEIVSGAATYVLHTSRAPQRPYSEKSKNIFVWGSLFKLTSSWPRRVWKGGSELQPMTPDWLAPGLPRLPGLCSKSCKCIVFYSKSDSGDTPVQCFFDFFMDLSSKTPTFESFFGGLPARNALKSRCFSREVHEKVKKTSRDSSGGTGRLWRSGSALGGSGGAHVILANTQEYKKVFLKKTKSPCGSVHP